MVKPRNNLTVVEKNKNMAEIVVGGNCFVITANEVEGIDVRIKSLSDSIVMTPVATNCVTIKTNNNL